MSQSRRSSLCITAVSLTLAPMTVAAGQSTVTVSPFVSYVPSATANPLAGLALTFGGTTGLAFRGSGELAIENPDSASGSRGGYRPWGADVDAMLFLGGLGGGATVFSRALSPYLFTGLGLTGGDSAGSNVVRNSWSYGGGAAIPLGLDADVFAEARWRMPEYVLPTARDAPSSKSEFRFGLSFHVGGGSGAPRAPTPRSPRPTRRHHADRYDDDVEVVAAQPAPVIVQAPAPVIVQAPAPVIVQAPAPVIVTQPAPVVVVAPEQPPSKTININLPGSVVSSPGRSRRVYVGSSGASSRATTSRTTSHAPSRSATKCSSRTTEVETRRTRASDSAQSKRCREMRRR